MMETRDFAAQDSQPIFAPVHMRGKEEIASVFGVHVKTVREWKDAGAPIALIGKRYQASYYDLWEWLKRRAVEAKEENV